ncbi:concanavalin A-like lectin/glucanase domain-containing protein, partial [Choanephora cucurbitarum]
MKIIYTLSFISMIILSTQAIELVTGYSHCDCGYVDPEHQTTWQEIWHMSFESNTSTDTKNVTRSIVDPTKLYSFKDLFFANYQIAPKFNDFYPRTFKRENVAIEEDALQIHIQSQQANSSDRYDVTCGGVGTSRQDFLYGSFRSYIKTTSLPGTVAGMFAFHPAGEVDIELISALKPPEVYFAMHPLIYEHGKASPATHGSYPLDLDPSVDYHEYRFDWFPTQTIFYVDGIERYRISQHVLAKPARVMLNHWTDGNPNFSQGPVKQHAVMSVKNITLFFNSSLAEDLHCQSTSICAIPSKLYIQEIYLHF